ncbi:hypothetical protein RhiLY_13284 [Ceratobasidium sp. AG-Ba]|nr:hypothetical protein RhiLY_13284 [Ceratobasidium sp. AG-Ba]
MPALSKLLTLAVACSFLAAPVASTSAFSRRHSHNNLAARKSKTHHDGSATYYNVEENTGACGEYHNNGEYVAAIGKNLWQQTQDESGRSNMCGKWLNINWQGKSVRAMVVDECEGCDDDSLDLSPAAFNGLSDPDAGRLQGITWKAD